MKAMRKLSMREYATLLRLLARHRRFFSFDSPGYRVLVEAERIIQVNRNEDNQ